MNEKLHDPSKSPHSPTMDRLFDPKRNQYGERILTDKLRQHYDQPHRHHHTLEQHVRQSMAFLDANADALTNMRAAKWAMLYSYSVFDPHATRQENKAASAIVFGEEATRWMSWTESERAKELILATADHVADPNDIEMQLFIDADLSILGAPVDIYRQYAADLRLERDWMSDDEYATERSAELFEFFARDQIFTTDIAHETLEERANLNMISELHRIKPKF